VLALSLVFLLAVWSLGFVTLQITRRSGEVAHGRSERLLGQAVGLLLERPGQPEALFRELCTSLESRAGVSGLRLVHVDGSSLQCGSSDLKNASRVPLANGDQLLVRLPVTRDASGAAFVNLLLFYLAFTGLAVLLLAYVLLTYLIVRPIERLTHSVEGLTAGMEHVAAPEEGSAEAARLARRFNDMAGQLRAKQAQLLARVRELERTTGDLRSKEQQLIHGEKLASVGRLAAGVAHEIGNPLAAILGLLELLRGGELSAAQSSEFLGRVQRETERIHRIIRDLLDFARRDADDAASTETSDLRAVIEDAVNLVKPQKESKDIAIDVAVDAGAGRVLGPRPRLTQIVLNLLLNAVDALDGRGRIEVSARPLGDGTRVLLQVSDDGPGIALEMQDKLFDPFTTTKPVGKGTGLGLAVTHAIVEGLGGRIEGKNREGGGACFEVQLRLPATRGSAAV
jgi:signal transduction histidine kinase